MKFSIERDCFLKLLKKVDSVCAKSNNFAILACCLIEANGNTITVTGNDLDITLRASDSANVQEEGHVVLNCKRLFDTVSSLDSGVDIMFSVEDNSVRIQAGNYKSLIPTADFNEYPPIAEISANPAVTIKAGEFKELIDKISFSISKDTNRVDFTGAHLSISQNGVIQLVSTDGHRLSRIEKSVEINGKIAEGFEMGVIVPGKGLAELSRTLCDADAEIHLDLAKNKILVCGEGFAFYNNLIAGQFPDFSKVIPPHLEHKAIVRREDFQKLLRRAGVYANKACVVRLTMSRGKIEISSYDQNNGEMASDVECEYDGSGVTAGFNWRYIDQILSVIGCDVISFEVIDMDSPAVVRDVTTDKLDYIVMPMQL